MYINLCKDIPIPLKKKRLKSTTIKNAPPSQWDYPINTHKEYGLYCSIQNMLTLP